jgi:peroxiredoxin
MKKSIILLFILLVGVAAQGLAQLPAVVLKDINGKTINTAKLSNEGKPFIITFFAKWCKPCNRELNAISEVYEEWQEETGVKVFAVSIDQAQDALKVKPFVDGNGWEFHVLLDPNGAFKRALGVNLIPHAIVCDGKGNIVESHSGYTEGGEEQLIEKVRAIIAGKK